MGSGERDKAPNRSIEDWLAQKLAAGLDDDDADTDPEPPAAPELPPLPEDLGGPADEAEQTMQATMDATLPAYLGDDFEHTREAVVEPSVPIPWPDWEPEPFPAFDSEPAAVREPSLPIPNLLSDDPLVPPWEGDSDPEPTVDLLAEETRAPSLGATPSLPPWEGDTDPENTSTLLRDDTPTPTPERAARPPAPVRPPARPKVEPPSPVKQLAAARAPRRRDATPPSAPGRAVAQQRPVADPRPATRPLQRRDLGAPVPTTWEEDRPDDDPELSYPGVEHDAPHDPGEPEIEDLEAAPQGNFDEVFPPPRARVSVEDWGAPTAIGRTAGGTPRDPPTVREDLDGGTVTAPRQQQRVSDEATDIRGFAAPNTAADPFLFDEQPTVIIKPQGGPPQEQPQPPALPPPPEDDYMTTLLAWTGASVGIIAFIVIVGISVLILQYLGVLEL